MLDPERSTPEQPTRPPIPQVDVHLPADADDFIVWASLTAADNNLVDDMVAVRDWTADLLDDVLTGKTMRDAGIVIDVANEWLLNRGLCTTCGLPSPASEPTGTCGHKDHDPWFGEDLPAFRAKHGEPYSEF